MISWSSSEISDAKVDGKIVYYYDVTGTRTKEEDDKKKKKFQ